MSSLANMDKIPRAEEPKISPECDVDETTTTTLKRSLSEPADGTPDAKRRQSSSPDEVYHLGPGATLWVWYDIWKGNKGEIQEMLRDLIDVLRNDGERVRFRLFGKECEMRRRQLMFGGKKYKFSGKDIPRHEGENPRLVEACMAVARQLRPGMEEVNAALVNLYEDPGDYISEHQDDESEHKKGAPIFCFSFAPEEVGGTRTLVIKRKGRKASDPDYVNLRVELPPGSLYIMEGENFQKEFTHQVPPGKDGERCSVTCRSFT